MRNWRLGRAAASLALVAIPASPTSASPADGYLLAQGSATIDGVKAAGEWDSAAKVDFTVTRTPDEGGGSNPATFYFMNDGANLYAAISIARPTRGHSSIDVEFDADDDDLPGLGDDVLLLNADLPFLDEYVTDQPPCPSGVMCGFEDPHGGGTIDGQGGFSNNGSLSFYEVSHPLNDADDAHDVSLDLGETVFARAHVRFCDSTCVDSFVPGPLRIAIAPLADLQLAATGPARSKVKKKLRYLIVVSTTTDAPAKNVVLTDALPNRLRLVSVHPSQGRCKGKRTIVCHLGAIRGHAQATIRVIGRPTQRGRLLNSVAVEAASIELSDENNYAAVETRVRR